MYKKITTSILVTCIVLLSCKAKNNIAIEKNNISNDSTLVYENNKVIGKIAQKTTFKCKI